jgi:hypothetical protein
MTSEKRAVEPHVVAADPRDDNAYQKLRIGERPLMTEPA